MKSDYTIVVAFDAENGIGKNGDLPWGHALKDDLRRFKQLTTGNTVVMGRKTYESIGRALPNRETIVLSTHANYTLPDATVITSPDELSDIPTRGTVFIVGGAAVYKTFLPSVNRVLATEVDGTFGADRFFPHLDPKLWDEVKREHVPQSADNAYGFDFVEYQRREG